MSSPTSASRSRPRAARGEARGTGLNHLSLRTHDLKATERFYTDVLGLEVAFRHRGMVFLRTPGSQDLLDFCEAAARFDPAAGGLDHFGVHVDRRRFVALAKRLRQARVAISGRRGRWGLYFEDPNGYTVELYAD
jgi:catechol-2,3-dioxygenase